MKNRRKEGSKLGTHGEELEKYFKSFYTGTYPKPLDATQSKSQSFLQVPLGEAKFLEMLVRVLKPKKILEIGTFRGFSTVFLAAAGSKIWTIERDQNRYKDIEMLFKKSGVSKQINLVKGYALPTLKDFAKKKMKFDFFFIDASKQETKEYFKICYNKLATKGALIVVDNTLWAGEVAEKEPTSSAAKYMKEFNEFVFKKHKKDSYILPGWDGVTIVIRK